MEQNGHVLYMSSVQTSFCAWIEIFFGLVSGELLLVVEGNGLFAVFVGFARWCGLFILQ